MPEVDSDWVVLFKKAMTVASRVHLEAAREKIAGLNYHDSDSRTFGDGHAQAKQEALAIIDELVIYLNVSTGRSPPRPTMQARSQ
jgi:hypothetical protein